MKTLLIIAVMIVVGSVSNQSFAEIKPVGAVQEYSCSLNDTKDSEIQKLCFAQIVGSKDQFVTTLDAQGVSHILRIAEYIETIQIGKGDQSIALINACDIATPKVRFTEESE